MLLSESKTRTHRLLDDVDLVRYDTATEIVDGLKSSQAEAWRIIADGSNIWTTETTITTTSSGLASLSSLRPIRIVSVAISGGTSARYVVRPARMADGFTNLSAVHTLRIAYVPRAVFPASDPTAFSWPSGVDSDLLDEFVCVGAAISAKVKTGEANKLLIDRKEELRRALTSINSIPRWSVLPLDAAMRSRQINVQYILTGPDSLQLVVP